MGRQPCCDKVGLKRGPWTAEEDRKLITFILTNGHCCWRAVPKLAGLLRCGKSCRLRWTNYLRPDLKRGLLSESEEQIVIDLHAKIGNKWSRIASHLPGRTDNEIKNHWNTHIKKKLKRMGIDPITHKPITSEAVAPEEDGKGVESGFCTDEVPMIQPEEILISPEDYCPMSSSSSSPSPNSSNTATVDGGGDELAQLPNLDWLEELWDMDGDDDGTTISGLDLIGGDITDEFLDRLMDSDWSNISVPNLSSPISSLEI